MAIELDIRAGEAFAFAVSPEMEDGGKQYTIRLSFRWLPRIGRWSCSPTTADTFEALGLEQHVGDATRLLLDGRVATVPPGRLVFLGEDPYIRRSLGDTIRLYYLTADEVSGG